ncbi:hypothetical protein XENOCAPTIV_000295 [Xenoophorus captivus]|uniref:Uncharacterized protein n=1 Tax=Xenoophorus captivus TaxID=1517983 RepID=A0ABV0QXJ2_9TELE
MVNLWVSFMHPCGLYASSSELPVKTAVPVWESTNRTGPPATGGNIHTTRMNDPFFPPAWESSLIIYFTKSYREASAEEVIFCGPVRFSRKCSVLSWKSSRWGFSRDNLSSVMKAYISVQSWLNGRHNIAPKEFVMSAAHPVGLLSVLLENNTL